MPTDPGTFVTILENFGFPVAVASAACGLVYILVRLLLQSKDNEITSYKAMLKQEREDRVEADRRLTTATNELKEVTSEVKELTKEVIRGGRA